MKIDTSTTAGKIKVMEAFEKGAVLEERFKSPQTKWEIIGENPNWHWGISEFRIKPQTVEEAAKDYSLGKYPTCADHVDIRTDFRAGVKWRDENPKEQEK